MKIALMLHGVKKSINQSINKDLSIKVEYEKIMLDIFSEYKISDLIFTPITPMCFNNILIYFNNILILLYCFNLINVLKSELSKKLK